MSKKRLLVIEDDVDVAEMLVVYFTSQQYEVLNATSGAEGIAMARAKFPNLILLDIMLPDMDGFDVCRALRTTTLTKYIPITFLTQRDARADKVAGLQLGADDYVTKPFDVEELRLRVQGSLRRSSRESLYDPRTGLATGQILAEMREGIGAKPNAVELSIQLAGYGPFREMYGFVAADEALAFVGQVINETIAQDGTSEDFAGIVNEERYTIVTFSPDINAFAEALSKRFSEGVKTFYNFVDSDRGFIVFHEAHDDEQNIPLMYLNISRVTQQAEPQIH
jgi:CheY-like chemotaxis protein